MADNATFSSFHRPRAQSTPPVQDVEDEPALTPILPAPVLDAGLRPPVLPDRKSEPLAEDEQLGAPFLPDVEDEAPNSLLNREHEPEAAKPPEPAPTNALDDLGELSTQAWADLSSITLDSDQLGLAHPDAISLLVRLPDCEPVPLLANRAGLYRPSGFRPAPWSGFAYDLASAGLTGLAAGTRILTSRGEVEVERLVPGDAVMALRGAALLPIAWIGRSVAASAPVRIEPGALGVNMPRRTLYLGQDQPVFTKPVPVTARSLINGTTIREADDDMPDLFHIDLGHTEVLLAEGVPLSSSHRASLGIE